MKECVLLWYDQQGLNAGSGCRKQRLVLLKTAAFFASLTPMTNGCPVNKEETENNNRQFHSNQDFACLNGLRVKRFIWWKLNTFLLSKVQTGSKTKLSTTQSGRAAVIKGPKQQDNQALEQSSVTGSVQKI